MHISRTIIAASDAADTATCRALALLAGGMALVTLLQVFFRYALNDSLFWSEELGRMLLVWLTFLGAAAAYKRGAHIGVDAVTARLPAKARHVAQVLTTLICLVFFCGLMVYGARFAVFLQFQTMAALGVSKSIPFLVIPLSGGVMVLHAVAKLAGDGAQDGQERAA